jgi:hypothetical protein
VGTGACRHGATGTDSALKPLISNWLYPAPSRSRRYAAWRAKRANGSLTSDGTYAWDARNRLTGIAGLGSFMYDGVGRRQTATLNGTATSYLYDGRDVAEEQQNGAGSADLPIGVNASSPNQKTNIILYFCRNIGYNGETSVDGLRVIGLRFNLALVDAQGEVSRPRLSGPCLEGPRFRRKAKRNGRQTLGIKQSREMARFRVQRFQGLTDPVAKPFISLGERFLSFCRVLDQSGGKCFACALPTSSRGSAGRRNSRPDSVSSPFPGETQVFSSSISAASRRLKRSPNLRVKAKERRLEAETQGSKKVAQRRW